MGELMDWRVLDQQDAFGERRADKRFAKLTAHLIAAIPFGGRRSIQVDDYRLKEFGERPAEPDPHDELRRFDAQAKGLNHG